MRHLSQSLAVLESVWLTGYKIAIPAKPSDFGMGVFYFQLRANMAAKYWLKLYHEMLDDPKVGRLPVNLKWRFIECLLMAGEMDEGGYLPTISDIAWRVRTDEETVKRDMSQLAICDMVELREGDRWFVTHFQERQEASTNAQRMREYRQRQRKEKETKRKEKEIDQDVDIDTYRAVTGVTKGNAKMPTPTPLKENYEEMVWSGILSFTANDTERAAAIFKAQASFTAVARVKHPYLNGLQKTYDKAEADWWEPLDQMVMEADGDLALFEVTTKAVMAAADAPDGFTISCPRSAVKTYAALLAKKQRAGGSRNGYYSAIPIPDNIPTFAPGETL